MGSDEIMDWKKIILTLLVIIIIAGAGYMGYRAWKDRDQAPEDTNQKIMEILMNNQEAIITIKKEVATIEKRVVNETLKEKTIPKETESYEGIKDQIIELKESGEGTKEEIEALRETFESRIDEFQASDDKIMIKAGGEKITIYEDGEGNMVSLNEGVEIIRHQKIKDDIITTTEEPEKEYFDKFKIGIVYNKEINPALAYEFAGWKDLSLNITGYDFEEPKLGLDIGYSPTGNIEIAGGVGLFNIKETEMIKEYYLRAGIKIEF